MKARKAIARSTKPIARGKPPRPVSAKRRAQFEQRRDVRMTVLARDEMQCQAFRYWPTDSCWGPLDVHEPLTRARGGDPLDPDQCLTLCRHHHQEVHANPARAESVGLLRHSWERHV